MNVFRKVRRWFRKRVLGSPSLNMYDTAQKAMREGIKASDLRKPNA